MSGGLLWVGRAGVRGDERSIMGWHHSQRVCPGLLWDAAVPSAGCLPAKYYGMQRAGRRELLWDVGAARGGRRLRPQPGSRRCPLGPLGGAVPPPPVPPPAREPPASDPVPSAPVPLSPARSPPCLSAVITNKAGRVLWDGCSTAWGWGWGGGWLLWSVSRGWLLWDGLAFVNYYGMRPAREGGAARGCCSGEGSRARGARREDAGAGARQAHGRKNRGGAAAASLAWVLQESSAGSPGPQEPAGFSFPEQIPLPS